MESKEGLLMVDWGLQGAAGADELDGDEFWFLVVIEG